MVSLSLLSLWSTWPDVQEPRVVLGTTRWWGSAARGCARQAGLPSAVTVVVEVGLAALGGCETALPEPWEKPPGTCEKLETES